jgi:hypothetical protein
MRMGRASKDRMEKALKARGTGARKRERGPWRITNGRRTFLASNVVSSFAFVVAVVFSDSAYSCVSYNYSMVVSNSASR